MKRLFLVWVLIATLTAIGTAICLELDAFASVDKMDATKLSFLTIAVFGIMTIYCGRLSWSTSVILDDIDRLKSAGQPNSAAKRLAELENIENNVEHGWFAVGLCEKLGLLGTICGFIIMLSGGINIQGADPQAIQGLLEKLSLGLSTAFVTTLVGLICSIALSLQCHNLSTAIEKAKK